MTPRQPSPEPFPFFPLLLSVYLPAFLFSAGWGMIIPVTPLFAKHLGASLGVVGFVVTMKGIGTLLFDLPAGILVAKVGTRQTMIIASFGTIVVSALTGLMPNIIALSLLSLAMGGCQSAWMLSRNAHLRIAVSSARRGRAISMLGGSFRFGSFAGPIVGGFIGHRLGLADAFLAQAAISIIALALIFIMDRTRTAGTLPPAASAFSNIRGLVRSNSHTLLTGGLVILSLGVLRSSRQILIPLWGNSIGLDVAAVGLIMGLGSGLDMMLFYPAGMIMDRLGRKWAMIPCLLILSLSFVLMPFAHDFKGLLLISLLAGLGNGFGAGIVMTLGADLAPDGAYGEFLGVWRLVGDIGTASGPAIVGVVAQVLALAISPMFAAVVGVAGALIMRFFMKETRDLKRV